MKSKVFEIVCSAIDEINENLDEDLQIKKEYDSKLFSRESSLESLDLVNLIVGIEQRIEDEFDISVTIANEKAMSEKTSPFRTVESLVNYILKLLPDENE